MKLRFLCTNRRTWLQENPHAAEGIWGQSCALSQDMFDAGQLDQAAHHAGCALEAADILLSHKNKPTERDVQRFCESCAHLVRLLLEIKEEKLAQIVLQGGLHRLQIYIQRGTHPVSALAGFELLSLLALRSRSRAVAQTLH